MALTLRKILVTDGIHSDCGQLLRSAGLEVTETGQLDTAELIQQLATHDTLLVRSATKVTAEVMAACPALRLVGRAGSGTDNIDTEAATRHGVIVMNAPGGNTVSAAEHTCAMIAAISRNLPAACASLKSGQWQRSRFLGTELSGKTLAVLGLGRIGREVAFRMKAFGMKIIGYDPVISAEAAREFDVEKRDLDDIWRDADYITVHTPLLPQTRNLINSDTLSRCKRGVRVVNVARGGIVDEAALLAALESGQCAAAGLDVFAEEPPTQLALVQHPATVCTPHLGANTREAQLRVARELAEQIVTAVRGGPLVGLVNATSLSGILNPTTRAWVDLARPLGAMIGRLTRATGGKPSQLEVTLTGADVGAMEPVLTSSVLVGLLSGATPNGINLVNAQLTAREAGIAITCHLCSGESTGQSVAVSATVDGVSHSVAGTLHGTQPILLELEAARFQPGVTLGGNMLFFQADGSDRAVVSLIVALASAHAQIIAVLTSLANSRGPIVAVRLQEPLPTPELLQSEHAKLLLQATF